MVYFENTQKNDLLIGFNVAMDNLLKQLVGAMRPGLEEIEEIVQQLQCESTDRTGQAQKGRVASGQAGLGSSS